MKVHHYLALIIRFFAIGILVYLVGQFAIYYEAFVYGTVNGYEITKLVFAIPWTLLIIVALVFWLFPNKMARTILRTEMDQTPEPVNAHALLTILILALGFYFSYFAISDSVYWLMVVNMSKNAAFDGGMFLDDQGRASIVATVFEVATCLILILGAKSLAKLAMKISR